MSSALTTPADGRVILNYTSPEGPTITHVRGILLANSIGNLRDFDLYGDYARLISPAHFEATTQALAASWVPIEHAVAHYIVCDELPLNEEHFKSAGERQARRIADTFLGSTLRQARSLGVDTLKQASKRVGRLHGRLNRGGGCTVIEFGQKDLRYEIHGSPLAALRSYRMGWAAYVQALASMLCKVAYVQAMRPHPSDPLRLAITISWV